MTLRIVIVGGGVYRGNTVMGLQGRYIFGYWSDSRTVGNGTILAATPPTGWAEGALPETAADLTPEDNAMWQAPDAECHRRKWRIWVCSCADLVKIRTTTCMLTNDVGA